MISEETVLTGIVRNAGYALKPARYRGLWKTCQTVGLLAWPGRMSNKTVAKDTVFPVSLKDPYWLRLFAGGFVYEPEVAELLMKLKATPYTFVDAGANFGYWSLLVSSEDYGQKPCIAIEAMRPTYDRLVDNVALNGRDLITTRFAAISHLSGQLVLIGGDTHQGAHIAASGHPVTTITIDDLLRDKEPPYILKLDVEDHEISALEGALETLKTNPLLIYEDHGNDRSHKITKYIMNDLELPVFYRGKRIADIDELRYIKTNYRVGYNFCAASEDSIFRPACGP